MGPLPRGAKRGKLLGIDWKGHGRRNAERPGWLARIGPVVAVVVIILVVGLHVAPLALALAGKPDLIWYPSDETRLWAVRIALLAFLVWLVAFTVKSVREGRRARRRRESRGRRSRAIQ